MTLPDDPGLLEPPGFLTSLGILLVSGAFSAFLFVVLPLLLAEALLG
ncbi:hypothetical protein [Pyruvatibacter mobilis]